MLLVQDSSCSSHCCRCRPFFYSIGLDLLMDMGMQNLHFLAIPKGWKFNDSTKMDYTMKPHTKYLLSCDYSYAMFVDKNGISRTSIPPVKEIKFMDEKMK